MKSKALIAASIIGISSPAFGKNVCGDEIMTHIGQPNSICESSDMQDRTKYLVNVILGGTLLTGVLQYRRRRNSSNMQKRTLDTVQGKIQGRENILLEEMKKIQNIDRLMEISMELRQIGKIEEAEECIHKALDLSNHIDKNIYISYLKFLYDCYKAQPSTFLQQKYVIFFNRTCLHFGVQSSHNATDTDRTNITQEEFESIRNWGKEIDPNNTLYDTIILESHQRGNKNNTRMRGGNIPTVTEVVEPWEQTVPTVLTNNKQENPVGNVRVNGRMVFENEVIVSLLNVLDTITEDKEIEIIEALDKISEEYHKLYFGLQERIKFTILELGRFKNKDYVLYGLQKIGMNRDEALLEKVVYVLEGRKIKIAQNGVYKKEMIEKDVMLAMSLLLAVRQSADFSYPRSFIGFIKDKCGADEELFDEFMEHLREKAEMAKMLFDADLALLPFKKRED